MTKWDGDARRRSHGASQGRASRACDVALVSWLTIGILVSIGPSGLSREQSAAGVRTDLDAGRYDSAESAARELLRTTDGATDLYIEARWRNGHLDPETRRLAERVVAERTKSAADQAALTTALANLGHVQLVFGEYRRATETFERRLAVAEQSADDSLILTSLHDLIGSLLYEPSRYDEARAHLDRCLELEHRLRVDDRRLARTAELSGTWFQRKGEYARSRPLLERALEIRERHDANHPDIVSTLALVGDQLWFDGKVPQADEVFRRALAIGEETLRSEHPALVIALRNLATAELELGNEAASLAMRERALRIAESNFGAGHPMVADSLNDLAVGYMARGDYLRARTAFERALTVAQASVGANHQDVATIVFNLAFLAGQLGDIVEARRHVARARTIWEKQFGPDHPFVATAWELLGQVLVRHGRAQEAIAPLQRALALRERAFGADHVDVAKVLIELARAYVRTNRLREGRDLARRAVTISKSAGLDSPMHATLLFFSAEIASAAGDVGEARELFERSLTIRTRVYGPAHLSAAQAQQGFAAMLARTNERSAAFTAALQSEAVVRAALRTTVRYLPERQALEYSRVPPSGLALATSLLDGTSSGAIVSGALDAVFRGRSLILDEIAGRRRAAADNNRPDLAPLWSEVAATRQRLANVAVRTPSDTQAAQYSALLQTARSEKEAAERRLAERSAAFKQEIERTEVGLDEIRAALPPQTALVSFLRYEQTANATPGRADPPANYAAYILASDRGDPIVVQLGRASVIDLAIASWRRQAARGLLNGTALSVAEANYRAAGGRLRTLIWDPLAPHLAKLSRVLIVPDGALNLVNFAALPIDRAEYLLDRGPVIHYLSAEREIVGATDKPSTSGALIIGGAAFNDGAAIAGPSKATQLRSAQAPCGTLQTLTFDNLPATLREANEIAGLWKAAPSNGDVRLAVAAQATERAFKQQAPGQRVLHLATHGFFLGGDCAPTAPGSRAVGGVAPARVRPAAPINVENPLLLSGLAFAGANQRAKARPKDEDGILTAEEIAAMNLQGTEWAVLSACDTALGEVKAGEGVFGLRRAFQIAGVRTVIMSLWSVEDETTRQWMRALYEARLKDRLDTADSVRAASLRVLRDRRAKHLSTHPFYWAAFVAAGDWR